MSTKQFTLTIAKEGLLAQGGLPIPSPFVYKGEITGVSFNTEEPGAGFSGGFFVNDEAEEPIILKDGLQKHQRGVSANFGGLAMNGSISIDDSSDRVVTINDSAFISEVKTKLAERLGCEVSDIS